MDVLRGRVVAWMRQADRLRIFFPFQPGLGDGCISVHAKLLISDDQLLRIGSSNINKRSLGVDIECDLATAVRQPDDEVADFICSLRRRLVAEHLDCSIEDLAAAESQQGGLIAAITALMSPGRSLRPLDCRVDEGLDEMVPDGGLVDPSEPISPDYFVASALPNNLEQLARFEKTQLGVNIVSCGTFHVNDAAGKSLDDTSGIEDFIVPVKLPQAAEALLGADKIHYL